jgi:acyl-coenzyme A thioesterase PaaI-like protein
MKTLLIYGTLGCTAIALAFMTTTFAADKSSDGVGKNHEPSVTVQTDVKFTRKLKSGQVETTASPSIRSLVGQKATVEVTMPNGETVTVNIETKIVPSENGEPSSINNSENTK